MARFTKQLFILLILFCLKSNLIATPQGINKIYVINHEYDSLNFYLKFINLNNDYNLNLTIKVEACHPWFPYEQIIYLKDIINNYNKIKSITYSSSNIKREFKINRTGNVYEITSYYRDKNNILKKDSIKTITQYIYNKNNKLELIEHSEKKIGKIFKVEYYYKNNKIDKVKMENYFNNERFIFIHNYDMNKKVIKIVKNNNFQKYKGLNFKEDDFTRYYYFLDNKLKKVTQEKIKFLLFKKEEPFINMIYYKDQILQYFQSNFLDWEDKYVYFDEVNNFEYENNKLVFAFRTQLQYFNEEKTLKNSLLDYINQYDNTKNPRHREKLFILEKNNLPIKILNYRDSKFFRSKDIESFNFEYEFY